MVWKAANFLVGHGARLRRVRVCEYWQLKTKGWTPYASRRNDLIELLDSCRFVTIYGI